jgi:Protein of unknown function (DUF3450)
LIRLTLLLAPLAILAFASPGHAQNPVPATAAEARMLIERAKQEIAQEEKTWTEEVAREREAETRRKQRFSEFTQDRLRLQQTLADQEQKLKATLAKMEGHQFRSRELAARFKQLGAVMAAKAKEIRPVLAAGLPYRLDKRLESLDLLIRDVEGGNISPEEAMNRLWTLEQNERRLAQEAEVYTGDFSEAAGDPVQVKYLRVGKQLMAFSSLDGSKLGMLRLAPAPDSAAAASRWVWVRESEMDRDTRQALKKAIETAEGKSVPGFVPVPVWKNAFAEPVAMAAPAAPEAAKSQSAAKGTAK